MFFYYSFKKYFKKQSSNQTKTCFALSKLKRIKDIELFPKKKKKIQDIQCPEKKKKIKFRTLNAAVLALILRKYV